jgi:hypothetical protein
MNWRQQERRYECDAQYAHGRLPTGWFIGGVDATILIHRCSAWREGSNLPGRTGPIRP